MPNSGTVPKEDWDIRLYHIMIEAGTDGIQQQKILHKLQRSVTADVMTARLEAWFAEKKVQKFEQKTKGRPRIIWRATKLLLTEYERPTEDTKDDDE